MSGAIFKTVLSLCFVALLAACSAGPASTPSPEATSGKAEPTAASSTSGEEVFFPQVRPTGPPLAVPSARGGGKLALDDKGCIRMLLPGKGPESGWVPVWPSDFELDTGGGKVRILNGRGKVVAEVGKRVVMGGGDITKRALRENEILDERTWRELFERCPPGYSYWLVGEGVHILSGGGGGGEEWPEKVVARVSGTQGIKFSGYVGTVLKDRRVQGTVPAEYEINTSKFPPDNEVSDGEVYMMMQKLGREGKLTCQIVVGEKVVSSDSTTAERDYCGPTWSPVE